MKTLSQLRNEIDPSFVKKESVKEVIRPKKSLKEDVVDQLRSVV